MVRVFFNPDFTEAMLMNRDIREENLQYVANIEVESLEAAREIGQNSDFPWTAHPLVTPNSRVLNGTRSISIGDVLEKEGEWFMMVQSGFQKI